MVALKVRKLEEKRLVKDDGVRSMQALPSFVFETYSVFLAKFLV